MPELILASTSPWRQRMLRDAGIHARAEPSGVDESAVDADSPESLVRELAVRKARAVHRRFADALVIGADQVSFDPDVGVPWGKPPDAEQHLARLRSMRGRTHVLVTGWAILGPSVQHVAHTETRMTMRADLTDAELEAYVATGEGSGCAGGYAAEGHGAFLFSRVEGDWFNVLGLPLFEVLGVLRDHGWRYGGQQP
jgi:septum formation protein